jgi:AcrR family transcriptional regulator
MARMSPTERLDVIIDAALAVMLRKGMAGTTVRDVAEQMGTSSGLIHHYVASMDDLLAAAFERAAAADLEATRAAMAGGVDPLDRLARFFENYARSDQDWSFQLWLDAWSEASRRPAVQATSRRLNSEWQQVLAETIRAGVAAGLMTCADPHVTAWRILSLSDGLALQAVAHRGSIDRQDVTRWSVGYAELELGLAAGALATTAHVTV